MEGWADVPDNEQGDLGGGCAIYLVDLGGEF